MFVVNQSTSMPDTSKIINIGGTKDGKKTFVQASFRF